MTESVVGIGKAGAPNGDVLSVQGPSGGGTPIAVDATIVAPLPLPVEGTGVAGVQAGGVLTVQGDPAGTPIPVSAVIIGADKVEGVNAEGGALPQPVGIGGSSGANIHTPHVYDLDSGGGTEWALGVNLRAVAGGGSVETGVAGNPLVVSSAQLPAALVGGRLDENLGAWLGSTAPTVGQKTMAASLPVAVASDQSALPVLPKPSAAQLSSASVSVAALGDNTLIAGVGGQTIRVYRLFLVWAGASDSTFKDGAASLTGAMAMKTGGTLVFDLDGEPWFTGTVAAAFILNLGTAVQVSGRIYYTQT